MKALDEIPKYRPFPFFFLLIVPFMTIALGCESGSVTTAQTAPGPRVVVALLDTGVDLDHRDLARYLVEGKNFLDASAAPEDDHSHGTRLAGIIVNESLKGNAFPLGIMPLKIANTNGMVPENRYLAEAVDHAVEAGAAVICLGVGSGVDDPGVADAVRKAYESGVTLIAPAGNDAATMDRFPARMKEVISVAGLFGYGRLTLSTNVSPQTSLLAPAHGMTTFPGDETRMDRYATSLAAAHVTAAAARILSENGALSPDQVRQTLVSSGDLPDEKYLFDIYGLRVLNPEMAVQLSSSDRVDATFKGLRITPPCPLPGQTVSVEMEILNGGNKALSKGEVALYYDDRPVSTWSLSPLSSGGVMTITTAVIAGSDTGEARLRAVVTVADDEDAGNDAIEETFQVTAEPVHDMAVRSIDIGAIPRENDTETDIRVVLENRGNEDAGSVEVIVQLRDRILYQADVQLTAGERRTLVVPWRIRQEDRISGILGAAVYLETEAGDSTGDNTAFITFGPGSFDARFRVLYADLHRRDVPFEFIPDAPYRLADNRAYLPVLHFFPEFPVPNMTFAFTHGDISISAIKILGIRIVDLNHFTADRPEILFDARNRRPRNSFSKEPPLFEFHDGKGQDFDIVNEYGDIIYGDGAQYFYLFAEVFDEKYRNAFMDGLHSVIRVPRDKMANVDSGFFIGSDLEFFYTARIQRSNGERWRQKWIEKSESYRRTMRVETGPELPWFHGKDRVFDTHFHTIAEYTSFLGHTEEEFWDVSNIAKKAFGGPLIMAAEAACAIGMIEDDSDGRAGIQVTDLEDQVVTTDHNVFYSGPEYNGGEVPLPTFYLGKRLRPDEWNSFDLVDDASLEFNLHRELGGTAFGEEICLNYDDYDIYAGPHMLHYGSDSQWPGPWHPGRLPIPDPLDWAIKNPCHVLGILSTYNALPDPPFSYAAHPHGPGAGWYTTKEEDLNLLDIATLKDYQRYVSSPLVNPVIDESWDSRWRYSTDKEKNEVEFSDPGFIFKGMQAWNQRVKRLAYDEDGDRITIRLAFNPFRIGTTDTAGLSPADRWVLSGRDLEIIKFETIADSSEIQAKFDPDAVVVCGIRDWFERIYANLSFYYVRTGDLIKMPRKLYLAAGTDAHGDFNYTVDIASAFMDHCVLNWLFKEGGFIRDLKLPPPQYVIDNAFGKLRTYVFSSEEPVKTPMEAYGDGNTCATDGPVLWFALDGDPRFDSEGQIWHDTKLRFENHEGRIGGGGNFDGRNTMLIRAPSEPGQIRHHIRLLSTSDMREKSVDITAWKMSNNYNELNDICPCREILTGDRGLMAYHPYVLRSGISSDQYIDFDKEFPFKVDQISAFVLAAEDSGRSAANPVLTGRFMTGSHQAITNPVWVEPVVISCDNLDGRVILHVDAGGNKTLEIPEETPFCVTYNFILSMDGDESRKVRMDVLSEGDGVNIREGNRLKVVEWKDNPYKNDLCIACKEIGEKLVFSEQYYSRDGVKDQATFVLYFDSPPVDYHGNTLNNVAYTAAAAINTTVDDRTPGACCLPGGECIITMPGDCDGEFLGSGTTCDPNPCAESPVISVDGETSFIEFHHDFNVEFSPCIEAFATMRINNAGGGQLQWSVCPRSTVMNNPNNWLIVSPASGTAPTDVTLTFDCHNVYGVGGLQNFPIIGIDPATGKAATNEVVVSVTWETVY